MTLTGRSLISTGFFSSIDAFVGVFVAFSAVLFVSMTGLGFSMDSFVLLFGAGMTGAHAISKITRNAMMVSFFMLVSPPFLVGMFVTIPGYSNCI